MVFGENLLENVHLLAGLVDHVEIVLFYTPTLHNFPSPGEINVYGNLVLLRMSIILFIFPPVWKLHPGTGKNGKNPFSWPSISSISWLN